MTRPRLLLVVATITAALFGACGGDDPHEFAGYEREPTPVVGDLALPDMTAGGAEFMLAADPGELLAVYFGYTHCPDFCPTTLSDLKLATQQLDDPERVDVAMITVDPERDLAVIADYVTSFFPRGHGLGTDDEARLAGVAAPFGAQWEISADADGEPLVAHTTSLYLVDEDGRLVLTWPFGVSIDDLRDDIDALLKDPDA